MDLLNNKILTIIVVCLMSFTLASCYYDTQQELYDYAQSKNCDTTNVTYSSTIAPILKDNCLGCHGTSYATLGGNISLNSATDVANIAKNNNKLNNSVGATTNYSMPKGGNHLSDCNLLQIQLWVSKGALNN